MTARHATIVAAIVCLSLLLSADQLPAQDAAGTTQENTETLAVDILLQRQDLLTQSAEGKAIFAAGDFTGKTGDPALPVLLYHVLLPPDVDYSTLVVELANCRTNRLKSTWMVESVPPARSRKDQVFWPDGLDEKTPQSAAYQRDAFLPSSHLTSFRPFPKRQWRMVEIRVCPFRYNPVSRQLLFLESFRVNVSFTRHARPTLRTRSPAMSAFVQKQVRQLAVNFSDIMYEYGVREDAAKEDVP